MFSKSEAALQERCTGCQIAANCPFTQLSPLALDHFVSFSRLKTYGPGITIFRQEEDALGLFIIRSGWLKLSHVTSEGHALTIGFCGPGNILGLTESLTDGVYEVNAVTLKEIELEYIQKSSFSRLLYDNPTLAVQLLKIVSAQAHTSMVELIGKSSNLPLAEQMMRRLKELAGTCGHSTSQGLKLDLSFTVQDLADSIGCSRQWASRLLRDMEKCSLIRRKGGSVILTPLALNR